MLASLATEIIGHNRGHIGSEWGTQGGSGSGSHNIAVPADAFWVNIW